MCGVLLLHILHFVAWHVNGNLQLGFIFCDHDCCYFFIQRRSSPAKARFFRKQWLNRFVIMNFVNFNYSGTDLICFFLLWWSLTAESSLETTLTTSLFEFKFSFNLSTFWGGQLRKIKKKRPRLFSGLVVFNNLLYLSSLLIIGY